MAIFVSLTGPLILAYLNDRQRTKEWLLEHPGQERLSPSGKREQRALRYRTGVLYGLVIISSVMGIIALINSHNNAVNTHNTAVNTEHVARNTREIASANAAECERVNHLRVRVDLNGQAVFASLQILERHLRQDLVISTSALRVQRVADIRTLQRVIAGVRYQPLTDCKAALAHPDTYKPPHSESYPLPPAVLKQLQNYGL